MAAALDFWFFIGSTYTYLAVERLEALGQRRGATVRWRPFNVRAIMTEQNNSPFRDKPVKAAYMRRDIERRAARHGIAFGSFPPYPVDPQELATRVALVGAGSWWCPAFTRAVYRAWFLEHRLPQDRDLLTGVLQGLGLDSTAVLREAESPALRDRFATETQEARSLGIFGSPTLVADGELFWGDDRIEDALDWLDPAFTARPAAA